MVGCPGGMTVFSLLVILFFDEPDDELIHIYNVKYGESSLTGHMKQRSAYVAIEYDSVVTD